VKPQEKARTGGTDGAPRWAGAPLGGPGAGVRGSVVMARRRTEQDRLNPFAGQAGPFCPVPLGLRSKGFGQPAFCVPTENKSFFRFEFVNY